MGFTSYLVGILGGWVTEAKNEKKMGKEMLNLVVTEDK